MPAVDETPNSVLSASKFTSITPSDTVDLGFITRGIWVGGSGNFVAVGVDGIAVPFKGAVAGSQIPIRCKRINSTDTTATDLVALW